MLVEGEVMRVMIHSDKKFDHLNNSNLSNLVIRKEIEFQRYLAINMNRFRDTRFYGHLKSDRGDVPGWVLVVLMTTGLVTAIWTIAAPRLTAILKGSLDSMNGIR